MHTQVHLILFFQLILLTPWLLINALKHTLLMSIECDYCTIEHRIITLCYITNKMRRAVNLFALGLLHAHTHDGRLRMAEAKLSSGKERTLWRHIPALISLRKVLCNTYTKINITEQEHSILVIIKFALSLTVCLYLYKSKCVCPSIYQQICVSLSVSATVCALCTLATVCVSVYF